MHAVRLVLFALGYPVAIVIIVQFMTVVRNRRIRWLVIHHLAVACIVAGWVISAGWTAVGINAAWLVISTVWYVLGGRRPSTRATAVGQRD